VHLLQLLGLVSRGINGTRDLLVLRVRLLLLGEAEYDFINDLVGCTSDAAAVDLSC
jgi:hypothetical protein